MTNSFLRVDDVAKILDVSKSYAYKIVQKLNLLPAKERLKKMQEAVMFLQKYDISINMAVKIFNKYNLSIHYK